MSTPSFCIGITGSSGFLGSHLAKRFREDGHLVREFRHSNVRELRSESVVEFNLGEGTSSGKMGGLDMLVHCAHDFTPTTAAEAWRRNVDGSFFALRSAKIAGVPKIVFVSSISAFPGCRSFYGRMKLAVEEQARSLGIVAIRLGLVWGAGPGGLISALARAASMAFPVPIAGAHQVLYLNHADDIVAFLFTVLKGAWLPKEPFALSCDVPWKFRSLLETLAAAQGHQGYFFPIPWKPCYFLLKAAESCGFRSRFRSDSLLSLMTQDPRPSFVEYHRLGLHFRDFDARSWRG